jgi:hypothetical protein
VQERPDPSASVEDAVLDLLRCYGYTACRSSITQGNLLLLEGKIKMMLAGGPSKAGANAFDRAKGLIAAQASTSCPVSGDARSCYDAVAWESSFQSLSGAAGDNAADILAVLTSKYSSFRRALVGKPITAAHPLVGRIAALASEWSSYSAKRIACADVCALGAFYRALLADSLARSFMDGSLFASLRALCAPLAALHVRPYAEIQRLATYSGVPGQEALVYTHRAYGQLFAYLGYNGWDGFCGNLLTMIGTNDQTHGKLAESVNLFITTELRHVACIVKGHLDSSLDSKVEVSFCCNAVHRILANADEATRMLGHHVLLGLVQLSSPPRDVHGGPCASGAYREQRRAWGQARTGDRRAAPAGLEHATPSPGDRGGRGPPPPPAGQHQR